MEHAFNNETLLTHNAFLDICVSCSFALQSLGRPGGSEFLTPDSALKGLFLLVQKVRNLKMKGEFQGSVERIIFSTVVGPSKALFYWDRN